MAGLINKAGRAGSAALRCYLWLLSSVRNTARNLLFLSPRSREPFLAYKVQLFGEPWQCSFSRRQAALVTIFEAVGLNFPTSQLYSSSFDQVWGFFGGFIVNIVSLER